ncbi:hypothetical protein [Caballeronia novacaledonica]|uniref:Uncharacterized protein n=1 Tax=Caballeronia novacaledonica TaxID=1544861 RepID=A0AA37IHV3_9BURK|nr:hypothetical protein [Caballeronia novacaledonica]GJH28938.1 hypothetical protein CBA19CS42_30500 [Caballeronia novacaledonica]
MPGAAVTIGCMVVVTPGASVAPDTGVVVGVTQVLVSAGGMPLATAGTLCAMVNSLSGVPYPLVIGPLASSGVNVAGAALVRMLDQIPSPPGVLTVLGPPAFPLVTDTHAP